MNYLTFDTDKIDHRQAYRLAIGSIVPRPIAWVSSMGADGVPNLAPFSFFTLVNHYPPMVSISVGELARSWEDPMSASSANFAPEEDEFAAIGLETVPGDLVDALRLVGAPVAMECRYDQTLVLGDEWKTQLVIGSVLRWHVREDMMLDGKYIDPHKLAPVGRLGGPRYCRTNDIFEMKPPFTTPDIGHPNDPKS